MMDRWPEGDGNGAGRPAVLDARGNGSMPCAHASAAPIERIGEGAKPVLVVLHQHHSTSGRVGRWLTDRGFRLDERRPRYGEPLPETMEEHSGAIVFGGPMCANDHDAFLRREIDWLATPLKEEAPLLGICLGAQMMARHLGARVYGHEQGLVEVGYWPIRPTEIGEQLARWPSHIYQWHSEAFDLPDGARLLASGDRFPNQAFAYGPSAFSVQFHPEITMAMVCKWSTRAGHKLKWQGAQPRDQHIRGHLAHTAAVGRWLDDFMTRWVALRNGRAE